MTANDVFEITVDLISERLDTGLKDSTNTINYEKRAPGLLTMIQNELCATAPIFKTLTITKTNDDEDYMTVSMPSDYLAVYQMLDSDILPYEKFRLVGTSVYVPKNFTGTMIYRYIPDSITSLSSSMAFSDYINSTIIPNALAAQLLLNENASISNYFSQRYEELKRALNVRQPAGTIAIKDMYDSSLSY